MAECVARPSVRRRSRPRHERALLVGVWACLLLFALGCETSFDPFDESDTRFAVQGYFDVSADTQYVRVAVLQPSAFAGGGVDATVQLEALDADSVTVLADSVFTFVNGAEVHNFWTATPIAANTTYRLSAMASDGVTAAAVFRTPAPAQQPLLFDGVSDASSPDNPPTLQTIRLPGVEKLADLRVTYILDEPATRVTISYADRVRRNTKGLLVIGFNAYEDVQLQVANNTDTFCPSLERAEVFVATTTDEWPDFRLTALETLVLPGAATNIEGGVGFVGGVATARAEWGLAFAFSINRAACLR